MENGYVNRWQEQLDNHKIHETLKEARDFVQTKHMNISSEGEIEKRRLLKLFDHIEEVLQGIDPEIVPLAQIDNINNNLRSHGIWNEISTFASDGNAQNLANANNQMTGHLSAVAQMQATVMQGKTPRLTKSLERQFDQFVKAVDDQRENLSTSLFDLQKERGALEARFTGIAASVDQKRAEADQLTNGWQSQFSDAQSERSRSFEELTKQSETVFASRADDLIEQVALQFEKEKLEFATEIEQLIANARGKHQEILDLHEIVAGDSVAAGYLQSAAGEKKQAGFWRGVSITFILVTAVWTVFAYHSAVSDASDGVSYWGQALKAFSVVGVLMFGAVYSSKQSNLHRQNEQKTKWLALEVKAIDPFIASLEPEVQNELKKALSEKLFGQMGNSQTENEGAINEHMSKSFLKGITDLVAAARK